MMIQNQLIEATILADTISPAGVRITTFEVSCPLHVHVQILTHRAFSRNAQSNRAIPTKILLKTRAIYVPSFWGKNKRGMSPDGVEVGTFVKYAGMTIWKANMMMAKASAMAMSFMGIHKETTNRLLAPYIMVKSIITATDFDNFFNLRMHGGAQNEIQDLAGKMRDAMRLSFPKKSYIHVPFASASEEHTLEDVFIDSADIVGVCSNKNKLYMYANRIFSNSVVKALVGRAARVSYLNHLGVRDIDSDVRLCEGLLNDKHMSPFEHIAIAANPEDRHGNLVGWYSYRSFLERKNSAE